MYLTILSYDILRGNEVVTYELPSYAAKFQCEDMEEYVSVTLGFNLSNCDWQTHEELPVIVTLTEQRQNA